MSLNSEKNITRRSWDTIPMPETVIAHINEIYCNEPNRFIFINRRVHPIGDLEITGVDKDTDDLKKFPTRLS